MKSCIHHWKEYLISYSLCIILYYIKCSFMQNKLISDGLFPGKCHVVFFVVKRMCKYCSSFWHRKLPMFHLNEIRKQHLLFSISFNLKRRRKINTKLLLTCSFFTCHMAVKIEPILLRSEKLSVFASRKLITTGHITFIAV